MQLLTSKILVPADNRQPSCTKSGPGRKHRQGDGDRSKLSLKQRRAGAYGRGLRNWINSNFSRAAAI